MLEDHPPNPLLIMFEEFKPFKDLWGKMILIRLFHRLYTGPTEANIQFFQDSSSRSTISLVSAYFVQVNVINQSSFCVQAFVPLVQSCVTFSFTFISTFWPRSCTEWQ